MSVLPPFVLLVLLNGCQEPNSKKHDTAPDTDADVSVEATLSEGGVVTCAAPDDRETVGPTYTPSWGSEWETQPEFEDGDPADPGWGMTVDDLDGDDVAEIVLANFGGTQMYGWDPSLQGYVDWTSTRLPDLSDVQVRAVSAGDIEGDGDLDLYLTVDHDIDRILLNEGGVFADGTAGSGLLADERSGFGAAWGDVDGDGDLDLFVPNAFAFESEAFEDGPDSSVFYQNQGDGSLADLTPWLPAEAMQGFSLVAALIDLDDDVDLDLYVVNDYGWLAEPNLVLLGVDGDLAAPAAATGLELGIAGMGLGLGDLNGDLVPDLLVSSWAEMFLLESDPGGWSDVTAARGIVPDQAAGAVVAWGNALADFDNDGDLDAFISYGVGPPRDGFDDPAEQPDELWLQGDDGVFTEHAAEWNLADPGMQRGLAVADLNEDGWLDIITRKLRGSSRAHVSNCGTAAWARLTLRQPGGNPFAIGARVVVESGGHTQARWITAGGTGLAGSFPLEAHFGLGEVDTIDSITVRWPDGRESRVEGVEARQRLRISRAE